MEVEAKIEKTEAELTTCSESDKSYYREEKKLLSENLNLLRKKEEQLRDKEKLLLESTSRTTGIFPR